MRAPYTRLFANFHGAACFEDREIELKPGFAVPPVEPLHSAQFLPADETFWLGAPATWKGDAAHPAPRRMMPSAAITSRIAFAASIMEKLKSPPSEPNLRTSGTECHGVEILYVMSLVPSDRTTIPL
jgi:hypothetical protein